MASLRYYTELISGLVNDRQRQTQLFEYIPKSVIVAGAGGIGTWVSIILAQLGVTKLHVFDHDRLETHNLNRLPASLADRGKNKAAKLAEFINSNFAGALACPYESKFDIKFLTQQELEEVAVIFDCTDNFQSQKSIYETARSLGLDYMRIGSKEWEFSVFSKIDTVWKSEEEQQQEGVCGITVPQNIIVQILAAVVGVMSYLIRRAGYGVPNFTVNFYDFLKRIIEGGK